MISWEVAWYFVIGISVTFYVILDGFDLGVGLLHTFVKKDEDRRVFLNAIGPVWDGNEVWLVIVGGALLAGFPEVYATLFSGFYTFCMLFLVGLIFRAAAIEFRSKQPSPSWRRFWDGVFSLASFVIAFGLGIVMGNLIQGIPLNRNEDFIGSFSLFFRPYPLLIGVLSTSLFALHGLLYLLMKTENTLQKQLRRFVRPVLFLFLASYLGSTLITWVYMPHMTMRFHEHPLYLLVPLLSFLAILNIPYQVTKEREGSAFFSSCLAICLLFSLFGIGTFPYMIRSSIHPEEQSLTIFNSASSELTLKVLMTIVAIGIPLVLAYGFYVYRLFRGKVKLDKRSY